MNTLPNFDELLELAKENPDAFETIRQQQIDQLINNADKKHQARLRGLQFQIDTQRQIHANSPMGACIKISKMMHESFSDLRVHLNQISDINDPILDHIEPTDIEHLQTADILAFPSS